MSWSITSLRCARLPAHMGAANSMPFSRLILAALLATAVCNAQTSQTPHHGRCRTATYVIRNFHFGSGESLPELKLHYLTLGRPHRDAAGHTDNAVLLLHGTGGRCAFPSQPGVFGRSVRARAAAGYHEVSTSSFLTTSGTANRASLRTACACSFPHYDYDDMVALQHTMLVDGLHVDHLRLILGTSMGCMQSFVWGETYPQFSDALAPFACLPVELAGRNRVWRYMAMQMIRDDPAWKDGDYTTEPVEGCAGPTI